MEEAEKVLRFGREANLRHLTPHRHVVPAWQRGPIVLCVLRNERARIAEFLRHYRHAGVALFAFVDNGSTDGTTEYLVAQSDVDVFATDDSFDATRKQGWINRLIERYGREYWYISVDADEHLVFEGYGELGFDDAIARFESADLTRVRARLIDMYSDAPVLASNRPPDVSLSRAMPYFDPHGYEVWNNHQIPSCTGGPRARLFRKLAVDVCPQLTKFPFFRLREGEVVASPHYIWPYSGNFGAGQHLALLHYKFDEDPLARIHDALDRKVYWNESAEYRLYLDALRADPLLTFYHEGSRRYHGPQDLIDSGLLDPLPVRDSEVAVFRMVAAARRARLAERAVS